MLSDCWFYGDITDWAMRLQIACGMFTKFLAPIILCWLAWGTLKELRKMRPSL